MPLLNVRVGCLVLAAGLVLAWAGCASPSSRISQNQGEFDAYPANIQAKIRAGEVAVGFTAPQVRMALGVPDGIVTRTTETGSSEIWAYLENRSTLGFGFGFGMSTGGSSSVGAGVDTGSGINDVKLQVVLTAGRVTAVERAKK